MTRVRFALHAVARVLGPAAPGATRPARPRFGWTIRELMLAIVLLAVALSLLRIHWGWIFALMAGGVVGCGLAPWYAVEALRKLDAELSSRRDLAPSTRAILLAQSYIFVWAAWYFAGILVALAGAAAWWLLGSVR